MHSLKDGALRAQIRAGNQPQPADQPRAQVTQNIAVQILGQDHVVLPRIHHQLHAGVVHNVLGVRYLRVVRGNLLAALEKQAVGELHNVRLVDGMNLFTAMLARELEGGFCNACRPLLGDDLERLHHAGEDSDLQTRVQVFGVLAEDHHVNVRVVGLDAGQRLHRPEAGVQVVLLAQRHVDGRKAATDGRCRGSFDGDAVLLDGFKQCLGDEFAGARKGVSAGVEAVPFERAAGLSAGGFYDADHSCRNLRTNSVARYQCDFVRRHLFGFLLFSSSLESASYEFLRQRGFASFPLGSL